MGKKDDEMCIPGLGNTNGPRVEALFRLPIYPIASTAKQTNGYQLRINVAPFGR